MADDEKIVVEVTVPGDAEVRIRKITEAVDALGNDGTKALGKFTDAFNVFAGSLAANAVTGGFNTLISLGKAFFEDTLVAGVRAAIQTEDAIERLNSALANSGKYTDAASKELVDFAQSMQLVTKYSDDQVLEAEALIQSMTRLDKEGLKKATKAALDLSAGLKQDLQTSALQVAQAVEGTAGRLSKLGLHLDEGADKAGNLGKVIETVSQNFGGRAQSEVNTFSGALAVLNHIIEDGKKETGLAIIQNQSLINVIKTASDIVNAYNQSTATNKNGLRSLVSDGIIFAIEGMKIFVLIAQESAVKVLQLAQAGAAARGVLSSFANAITLGMTDAGLRAAKAKEDFDLLGKEIEGLRSKNSVTGELTSALTKLGDAAQAGVGKVASNASLAEQSLQAAKRATEELSKAQYELGEQGKKIAEEALAKADPQLEFEKKLDALIAFHDRSAGAEQQAADALVIITQQRDDRISEQERKKAEEIIAINQALSVDGAAKNSKEILDNQAKLKKILDAHKLNNKDKANVEKAYAEQSKAIEQNRVEAGMGAINALATLQNAKTKEIAIVGKAAAIAQATIDTYVGAGKAGEALAPIPFVGPALAAAAIAAYVAAGLFRVAQIAGVGLATGIDEVPPGYNNDNFPARLTSGEGVLDKGTNADVKSMAGSWPMVIGLLSAIVDRLEHLENHFVVNVGSRVIIDEVREAILGGRSVNAF